MKPRYKHIKNDRDVFLGHYDDNDLYIFAYPDKTIAIPFYKNTDDSMYIAGRDAMKERTYNEVIKECLDRAYKRGYKKDPLWER